MSQAYTNAFVNGYDNSRRHSMLEVPSAAKWRQRSHSMGLVNLKGLSTNIKPMGTHAEEPQQCPFTPRMAFNPFNFESPFSIHVSKGGMLNPKVLSRWSWRRLPRAWKVCLAVILCCVAATLFVNRKMTEVDEAEVECTDPEQCDGHGHDNMAERFMNLVSLSNLQQHFHSLTGTTRDQDDDDSVDTTQETQETIEVPTQQYVGPSVSEVVSEVYDLNGNLVEGSQDPQQVRMVRQAPQGVPQGGQQVPQQVPRPVKVSQGQAQGQPQLKVIQGQVVKVVQGQQVRVPVKGQGGQVRGQRAGQGNGKQVKRIKLPPGVNPKKYTGM